MKFRFQTVGQDHEIGDKNCLGCAAIAGERYPRPHREYKGTALSAEILFLRKQLAFYEERQTQPRRLTDRAHASLLFWSRLFDWKNALVIMKPETLIGWHRRGFKLFWRWKSQA